MIASCSHMQGEDILEQVSCVLHLHMQEEDIVGYIHVKHHCVRFSQLVDHCVREAYVPQ